MDEERRGIRVIVHAIGFLASVISFVLWLPQARETWRSRNSPERLRVLSTGTQYLVVANASLWFAYGALTGEFWVAAPGFINLPLAVWTVHLIHRSRRRAMSDAPTMMDV